MVAATMISATITTAATSITTTTTVIATTTSVEGKRAVRATEGGREGRGLVLLGQSGRWSLLLSVGGGEGGGCC
jgi:hypothetical protein